MMSSRIFTRGFAVLVLIHVFAVAAVWAQNGTEPIVASDLLKIQVVGSPALSPDGRQVIYTVTKIVERPDKKEEYAYRTQLFIAPTDGSTAPRPLTSDDPGAAQPVWHPSGDRIAFVRVVKDKPQIFILPLTGGEAYQLTKFDQGAGSPRWSPDGKKLLFVSRLNATDIRRGVAADVAGMKNPAWPAERPGRTPDDVADWRDPKAEKPKASPDGSVREIREWLEKNAAESNPRVLTRLNFQGEADLEPSLTFSHIFVIEARDGAKPIPVTGGFSSFDSPQWTPDGNQIVFSGSTDTQQHPDRVLDRDLFLVNADGTGFRQFLNFEGYSVFSPSFTPDGKTVLFLAQNIADPMQRSYGQTKLGLLTAGTVSPRLIEDVDRSVGNARWSPDGRTIYFTAASNGGFPLYRIPPTGGPAEQLTDFTQGVTGYDLNGKMLVFSRTEVANPSELYVARPDAKDARRLSAHNVEWLSRKKLSFPEKVELSRPDKLQVEAWIMKPTFLEAGKKYPLLLEIHGGPAAMWGPGEFSMWHEFQFFAARGYGVVYSNPRGSGGYGFNFQKANFQDWGDSPMGDVLAAAERAARESWADPDRQIVTGGSYAGYLVAYIIGHDNRFKAAVAQRGVYDLDTFLGEGNAWRLVPNNFGGYPWEEKIQPILRANSPITYVEKIRTPFLIIHGDNDLRTGVIQSEMLYKSLKILGREVEYVRYPRATHELTRSGDPRQRMDHMLRMYEFFERYLGK